MSIITGVGSGGYAGHLTPQLFMWDIDMYIPLEKNLIPSYANYVLRCREKQSDGSEYKKTLLRPDPAEGAYSAPANPLGGGEGLAAPSSRTPSPALCPSGLASPTPLQN